jgi:hypothetical protein
LTLEQLAVVSSSQISFPHKNQLLVEFTPTIPHCSMATLIGRSGFRDFHCFRGAPRFQRSAPMLIRDRLAFDAHLDRTESPGTATSRATRAVQGGHPR